MAAADVANVQRPENRLWSAWRCWGKKVWAAAGRDRTGTGQGRARSGVGFPFPSLFPSLSLSPVPCRCRALKPPIRWHRGPGRAGWCCWLVVGDPRGVAVGSGIVVGAWAGWPLLALVRGRHPHSRGRHPPRTPRDGPEVVDSTAAGRLTRAVPGSPTGGREGWQRGPPRKGVEMGGKVGVNGKWGGNGKKRGQEREMAGWGHASATRQRGKWEMENKTLFKCKSPPPQASEREEKNQQMSPPPSAPPSPPSSAKWSDRGHVPHREPCGNRSSPSPRLQRPCRDEIPMMMPCDTRRFDMPWWSCQQWPCC